MSKFNASSLLYKRQFRCLTGGDPRYFSGDGFFFKKERMIISFALSEGNWQHRRLAPRIFLSPAVLGPIMFQPWKRI